MNEYEDYMSRIDPYWKKIETFIRAETCPEFEEFLMELNFGGYVPLVPADDDNGEEEECE